MAYMKDVLGRRLDTIAGVIKPSTRSAAIAVTAPNSSTAASALDLTQRTLASLPFAAPRWRMKFRNMNLRNVTALTTPHTITGIWVGSPARETATNSGARWNGNTTAAPVQVAASPLTVPTNGTFVYSPWITGYPFVENVEKVISWGVTSTATGTGSASGSSFQGVSAAGASNAGNQTLSSPTIGVNNIRLDVLIEYEFAESVRSGLFVGDSNTVSYSPAGPPFIAVNASPSSLPTESWPALVGQMAGCATTNLGVGSVLTSEFASGFPALWDRGPTGAVYDFAIVSLGTNGLTSGYADFITRFLAINTYLRGTVGVQKIYWTTVTPRAYPDGAYTSGGTKIAGTLTADVAAGASTISSSFSATLATSMTLGLGPNGESLTVNSQTGSGPYVWTLSGTLANAHVAGEPVFQGDERTRRLINNFLRQLPDGIAACFDFERALELSPGSYTGDPRYMASDYLHFQRGASIIKASTVVGSGVRPLFA